MHKATLHSCCLGNLFYTQMRFGRLKAWNIVFTDLAASWHSKWWQCYLHYRMLTTDLVVTRPHPGHLSTRAERVPRTMTHSSLVLGPDWVFLGGGAKVSRWQVLETLPPECPLRVDWALHCSTLTTLPPLPKAVDIPPYLQEKMGGQTMHFCSLYSPLKCHLPSKPPQKTKTKKKGKGSSLCPVAKVESIKSAHTCSSARLSQVCHHQPRPERHRCWTSALHSHRLQEHITGESKYFSKMGSFFNKRASQGVEGWKEGEKTSSVHR